MSEQPTHFKLRESYPAGRVLLFRNDEIVASHTEYAGVAEIAQRTYGLSDASLLTMYLDYREDYDAR